MLDAVLKAAQHLANQHVEELRLLSQLESISKEQEQQQNIPKE
jgi:hypothetical protein